MAKIEAREVAVRVTFEYKCALCGKIERGDQIVMQPRTTFESFGLPKDWRQLFPWAFICPDHGKVEVALTNDGELFKPKKMYFFEQENWNV